MRIAEAGGPQRQRRGGGGGARHRRSPDAPVTLAWPSFLTQSTVVACTSLPLCAWRLPSGATNAGGLSAAPMLLLLLELASANLPIAGPRLEAAEHPAAPHALVSAAAALWADSMVADVMERAIRVVETMRGVPPPPPPSAPRCAGPLPPCHRICSARLYPGERHSGISSHTYPSHKGGHWLRCLPATGDRRNDERSRAASRSRFRHVQWDRCWRRLAIRTTRHPHTDENPCVRTQCTGC